MIPRRIHRIWLDDPMPNEYVEYGWRWRMLHPQPDWVVFDWMTSSLLDTYEIVNADLILSAREVFPKDWKRFQSDLLRLELLNLFGGVYVDCDVEPLKPFDALLSLADDDDRCLLARSPNVGPGGVRPITQAVMIAPPGHSFIRACIERAPEDVVRYGDGTYALWRVTGPGLITRTYDEIMSREGHVAGVTLIDSRTWYPQSNVERDAGVQPDLQGAYAWHRWANTRDNRRGGVK